MKPQNVLFSDFIRKSLTVRPTFHRRFLIDFDGPVGTAPKSSFLSHVPGKHIREISPKGAIVSHEAWYVFQRWNMVRHCPTFPKRDIGEFKTAARWAAKRQREMSYDEFSRCFLHVAELHRMGLAEPPPEKDPPGKRRRGRPSDWPAKPHVFANSQPSALDDPDYIEWMNRDNAPEAEYDEYIRPVLPKSTSGYDPSEDLCL